jgi:hypothetical protein
MNALSKERTRELLRDVDVYKVGHHGSLNATPKSLWALFRNKRSARPAKSNKSPLKTFMSTRPGKYGSRRSGTEVPRTRLVEALKAESNLFSTEDLRGVNQFADQQTIAP